MATAVADSPVDLMTARELVAALAEAGVGDWGHDAVRQWTREEPALPIAKPGHRGQAHRYSYAEAVAFLERRESSVKVKGFTTPGSMVAGGDGAAGDQPAAANYDDQRHFSDPRLEKAHQEAQLARIKRMQMEGRLIDVEEIAPAWAHVVTGLRSALMALPRKIDQLLEGVDPGEDRVEVIEEQIEAALRQVREDVAPGK